MRRKGLTFGLVVLVSLTFGIGQALADIGGIDELPMYELIRMHFTDWTGLYDNDSSTWVSVPSGGIEGRAIVICDTIDVVHPDYTTTNLYSRDPGSTWELTAVEYDFVIGDAPLWLWNGTDYTWVSNSGVYTPPGGATELYFVPGERHGGRIDIYEDQSPDMNPDPLGAGDSTPSEWSEGTSPSPDTFTTFSDGTLVWTGTYIPLGPAAPGTDGSSVWPGDYLRDTSDDPYLAFIDTDGDNVAYGSSTMGVTTISGPDDDDQLVVFFSEFGTASESWIDITGGPLAWIFMHDYFGPRADMEIDADISGPAADWLSTSDDPVKFFTAPEPATLSLLGISLIGLVGGLARRKRKGAA